MNLKDKCLAGLRRHQQSRRLETSRKLMEALDRMDAGTTIVVGRGFRWNKTTLAQEAGVNINTLGKKGPDDDLVFRKIIGRLEELSKKRRRVVARKKLDTDLVGQLRRQVREHSAQGKLMALELHRLGQQVLEERARADLMESSNASLRKEILRLSSGHRDSRKKSKKR
jgi:hypothetical protein